MEAGPIWKLNPKLPIAPHALPHTLAYTYYFLSLACSLLFAPSSSSSPWFRFFFCADPISSTSTAWQPSRARRGRPVSVPYLRLSGTSFLVGLLFAGNFVIWSLICIVIIDSMLYYICEACVWVSGLMTEFDDVCAILSWIICLQDRHNCNHI